MSARTSLGKHEPPNPGPACRNFNPILLSSRDEREAQFDVTIICTGVVKSGPFDPPLERTEEPPPPENGGSRTPVSRSLGPQLGQHQILYLPPLSEKRPGTWGRGFDENARFAPGGGPGHGQRVLRSLLAHDAIVRRNCTELWTLPARAARPGGSVSPTPLSSSFHLSSFAMRWTVPVPMPSALATLKIPIPFASCFRTLRSVVLSIFGRPSFTP
jgi:hypothetical protein